MPKQLPPVELLRQLLAYDPDTGALTWLPRPLDMFGGDVRICGTWNTRYAGKPALNCVDAGHGYRVGAVLGRSYLAHRVAWKLSTGGDPSDELDHINGDRTDNRRCNLRVVSRLENQKNTALRSNNKTGVVGVYWHKVAGKWCATLGNRVIGRFPTFKAAVAARRYAEHRAGYHPNHGKRKGRPKPP
jgi:hypothetical protein